MAHLRATRLGDPALHQGASVKVDLQRSASRSAMTVAEALPRTFTSRGAASGERPLEASADLRPRALERGPR